MNDTITLEEEDSDILDPSLPEGTNRILDIKKRIIWYCTEDLTPVRFIGS